MKSPMSSKKRVTVRFQSTVIGSKVMRKLEAIDHVAYVRYASVYRQFEDVGEFIDEIQSLGKRRLKEKGQVELFP